MKAIFQLQAPQLACDGEVLFDAPRMALLKRGLQLILKPKGEGQFYKAFEEHLSTQKSEAVSAWAEGKKDLAPLDEPSVFWKGVRQTLTERYERHSAYKIWFLAALSPEGHPQQGPGFLKRLREAWSLSWTDTLPLSQAALDAGALPGFSARGLSLEDKQLGLALLTLILHADGSMHVNEIAIFKESIVLLGMQGKDLAFLKGFADQKANALCQKLSKESLTALLPFLFRVAVADEAPRPSELEVLRSLIASSALADAIPAAALRLLELERGLRVEL